MTSTFCRMEATLSHSEPCPGMLCPFWERWEAITRGRCAFEQLDLRGRPELAAFLLGIRRELEATRAQEDADRARRLLRS